MRQADSTASSAAAACVDLYHTIRKAADIGGVIYSENVHHDHNGVRGSVSQTRSFQIRTLI